MKGHCFPPARFLAASVAVFIFCLLLAAPVRAQVLYTFELGFDFHSGDYGTGITTDASTSYVTLGLYPGQRFDVRLTLPWLYQSSGATTSSGGVRFGAPGEQLGGTGSGGEGGGSGPMLRQALDALSEEESVVAAESRSGLGDMTLVAGYAALLETERLPLLRPTVMVKFPTADDDLGTGEYDMGIGIEMSKWLNGWYLFGSGSAVFQGGKEGLGLKDFRTYEGGAGYRIGDRLLPFLSLWGASSPAESSSALLEARFDLSYRWSDQKGLSVKAMRGLSDSSPDYGFGGAIFVVF